VRMELAEVILMKALNLEILLPESQFGRYPICFLSSGTFNRPILKLSLQLNFCLQVVVCKFVFLTLVFHYSTVVSFM
jgi:hypothetical protein